MPLSTAFLLPYVGTAALTLVVCFLTWYLWQQRPKNSPPGSNGYPLLGNILSLGGYNERTMTKWAKQYGPIYMMKVGPVDVVIISSPEIAYEAYAKSTNFNDRPQSNGALSDGNGIVFIQKTDFHTEQRRFGLMTLRSFGMGRRTLEPQLVEVSNNLCLKIDGLMKKEKEAEPIDFQKMMYELTSSVISVMIFGSDISSDNEEFKQIINRLAPATNPSKLSYLGGILMFAPALKHIFPFSYFWRRGIKFRMMVRRAVIKEIDKHVESLDHHNPRDFIDCFLIEMEKFKLENAANGEAKHMPLKEDTSYEEYAGEKGDFSSDWKRRSSFDIDQLVGSVRDLFLAGVETTATTLSWILLYLSKHTEVQKKLQNEIDDVLGPSGIPRMAMMEKLPYVRAVIQEILRIRPTAPLSVPHKAAKEATLSGYNIPKGAIILTNIWGIHHDETQWSHPEQFMPERHLDENGKLMKSDYWMPFDVGGRSCLGQQLAKMELFITTIMLFQRFEFSLEPGYEPDLNGRSIVVLRPFEYKVCALRR